MTPIRRLPFVLFVSLLLGAVPACGSDGAPANDTTSPVTNPAVTNPADSDPTDLEPADLEPAADGFQIVSAAVERSPSDPAAASDAGTAVGAFGFDLYAALRSTPGNLAVSPYSVAAALAMTRAGAAGVTADEMDTVLHVDLVADLDAAFGSLDAELATRAGDIPSPAGEPIALDLSFGNALWPQDGFPFETTFLESLADHYGAGVNVVDYLADTEVARRAINGWVAEQTRDRIPELIAPGVVDSSTRLVLTNALYLNAPWQFPFNEGGTRDGDFTLFDGTTTTVPFMSVTERFATTAGDGWQAVQLPYAGGALSMTVLVPDADRFTDIEADLRSVQHDVDTSLTGGTVELRLPSWEYRTQIGLNDPLRALGMVTAFGDGADFSAMSPEPLFVSEVVHEVFVSVDEDGTEAAAATAVVMAETAAPADDPIRLDVDRPFMYWITDDATGALLFVGRVVNPAES